MKPLEIKYKFINNNIDLKNSPDRAAFEIYCVDNTSIRSMLKGWLIGLKFQLKMMILNISGFYLKKYKKYKKWRKKNESRSN